MDTKLAPLEVVEEQSDSVEESDINHAFCAICVPWSPRPQRAKAICGSIVSTRSAKGSQKCVVCLDLTASGDPHGHLR